MSSITSSHVIALGLSHVESSGIKNARTCNITAHVSISLSREFLILTHTDVGTSSTQYLEAVSRREIDWINTYANPQRMTDTPWQYTSVEQDCPEAHVALLQKFLSAIPHIVPKDEKLVSSRIWHPDFHAGNIYVDDQARISSIIDWQGAWTTPVFIGAKPPLLLDYGIDILMKLPDNFKELDAATKDQLRYQVSQSILIHEYETSTAEKNPLMYKMMHHPHGQTLKQLEAFAGATWDNCLYPFEECLIHVERYIKLCHHGSLSHTNNVANGIILIQRNHARIISHQRQYTSTTKKPRASTKAKNYGKVYRVS
jgi:hypothetical protein